MVPTGRTLGVARVSFGYNSFESNDAIQFTLAVDITVVRMVVITQLCQCDSDVCAIISRE